MKNNKNITLIIIIFIALSIALYAFSKQKEHRVQDRKVSVYFVKQVSPIKNQVIPVNRSVKSDKFESVINELLKGPSEKEKSSGLFTEIPEQTRLVEVKESPTRVDVNLSDDFSSGGGSESMKLRLRQLSYTAIDAADGKPVYLELNSKKVEFIGGEGLEIPQPLAKDSNK